MLIRLTVSFALCVVSGVTIGACSSVARAPVAPAPPEAVCIAIEQDDILLAPEFSETPKFAIRAVKYPKESVQEQLVIELINRARANPLIEAERLGIDLNEGLSANQIDPKPKQPLAVEPNLVLAARFHSADMLKNNYFGHDSLDGRKPWDRAKATGWVSSGGYSMGENLSGRFRWSAPDDTEIAFSHHDGLFRSPGHRSNLMGQNFRELGVGISVGPTTYKGSTFPQSSMATELFAYGGRLYLTGVAIEDADGDKFYDIGEGRGEITVEVTNSTGSSVSTTTTEAGGWSVIIPSGGTYSVVFSHPNFADVRHKVTVVNENVKVDAYLTRNENQTGEDFSSAL